MELGVFSTASLELHVPSVNSGSDDSILHSRERVYFDEELSFELRIFLRNLDITFEQAERLFRSPALRLVAEVGYLEGSSHAAPEQQRHSSGSSSIRQQYPPAITPATAPQVSPEDTQYASLPVSQVIWSAPWETASPEDLRVSQGGDKSWMGIFRWKRVPIGKKACHEPPSIKSSM